MPDGRPSLGDIFGVQDDRPPLGAIFGTPDFSDVTGGVSSTAASATAYAQQQLHQQQADLLAKRAQMAQARQIAAAQGLAGPAPTQGVGDRLVAFGDRFVSAAGEGLASIPELAAKLLPQASPSAMLPSEDEEGRRPWETTPYPTLGTPGGFFDLKAQREDIARQNQAHREALLSSEGDPSIVAGADTLAEALAMAIPLGEGGRAAKAAEDAQGAVRLALPRAVTPAARMAADLPPEEAAYLARRAAALRALPGATEAPLRPGAVVDAMQPERSLLQVGAHADDLSQDVALGLRARPQDAADAAELARASQTIDETAPPSLPRQAPPSLAEIFGGPPEPIRGYHGSPRSDLTILREGAPRQFDNATSPLGIFFSPEEADAARYAGPAGKVYPADLRLQNPYEMPWGDFGYYQDITHGTPDADGLRGPSLSPSQWGEREAELKTEVAALRSRLETAGHDGVIVRDRSGNPVEIASFKEVPLEAAPRGDLMPRGNGQEMGAEISAPNPLQSRQLRDSLPGNVPEMFPPDVPPPPALRNLLLTGEELPLDTPRTGTTHAITRAEQDAAGLPRTVPPPRVDAWEKARQVFEQDPQAARQLAQDVTTKPRPLDDFEEYLLKHDRAQLKPAYDEALATEENALASGDPAQAAAAKLHRLAVERDYQLNADAADLGGRKWGESGRARQVEIGEDYSPLQLVRRYKVANLGEDAPDAVRTKLVDVSRQLEAAQTRLAAAEERAQTLEAQRMIHSENQAAAREIRSKGRAAVTAGLDQEYAGLSTEWRKATGLAQAGVNPDQAAILARMARNRVRAGVTNLQDLVDGIFQDARPHLDTLEPHDVRDAIAGASPKAQAATKKAAVSEFTALRREARVLNALEDARARLEAAPDSRAHATLQKEVARWEAEAEKIAGGERRGGGPLSDPERIRASLTRNATRQAELRDQIASGTVISKTRAPVADYPLIQARAETQRLQREADAIIGRRELQNRSWLQKGLDLTAATARFVPLTSATGTLPKLAFAAGSRSLMVRPAEQLLSALDPYLPLLREFSAEAPVEGGGVGFSALKKGYQGFFSKEAAAESLAHLKGEEGPLALALGKAHQPSGAPAFMDYPGHVHAAVKAPSVVSGYNWAMETQAKAFERTGREITPEMRQIMRDNAWEIALHDILLTDNASVQRFNLALQKLPQDSRYTRVGIATIRSQLPIVKVPTNYAARLTEYLFGLPKAGFGMGEALIKGNSATKAMKALGEERTLAAIVHAGLQQMPPGSADYIMRNLKRGRLGAALAGLVLTGTVEVGGYYRKGEHRSENDLQPGEIRIPGARLQLPHNWLHNPAIESMQVVGTIQNSKDLYTGLKTSGHGIMEQLPFLEETQRVGLDLPNNPAKFAGMATRQISEPPDVQKFARILDQDRERTNTEKTFQALGLSGLQVGDWKVPEIKARKRTPHGGFLEQLLGQEMLGVPGLRDNVR